MAGSLQIGKVLGIRIRLHFSWAFIFFFIAWSLASAYLPDMFPEWSRATYWGVGIAGSVILLISVLIHELSHSVVAISRGHRVRAITLFLLGGVSEIEDEAARPGEEFWIAVVGPLSSLILAGISWGVLVAVGSGGNEQLRALLVFSGTINLVMGVFNLIPGFPLDGGRVLRSIVWRSTGSLERATRVAAAVGIFIGFAFIGVGILVAFTSADFVGGLWLILIGWFIQSAASATLRQQAVKVSLSGRKVRDAVREGFHTIEPRSSVQDLIDEHIAKEFDERAFVIMLGNTFHGLVTVSDIRRVPRGRRGEVAVTEIMTRAPEVVTVGPEDPLETALQRLAARRLRQLVVVDDDRVVGLITIGDALSLLEIADLLAGELSPA